MHVNIVNNHFNQNLFYSFIHSFIHLFVHSFTHSHLDTVNQPHVVLNICAADRKAFSRSVFPNDLQVWIRIYFFGQHWGTGGGKYTNTRSRWWNISLFIFHCLALHYSWRITKGNPAVATTSANFFFGGGRIPPQCFGLWIHVFNTAVNSRLVIQNI